MSFKWKPAFSALTVVVCAVVVASLLPAQVQTIPVTTDEKAEVSGESTQIMMQAKLVHSHKVMEGLVTHDFETIEKAASALTRISLNPPPEFAKSGDTTDAQVYEHFRMEFARLAGQLQKNAQRKELQATAYVQQNLTATCIACHEYIRDYQNEGGH